MMNSGEKSRDYSHEYKIRQKHTKRVHADIKKEQAAALQSYLKAQDKTFIKWLCEHIENDLNK